MQIKLVSWMYETERLDSLEGLEERSNTVYAVGEE